MTLLEARERGIRRVRRPVWADPREFLQINGLWCYLVSPGTFELACSDDVDVAADFQEVLMNSTKRMVIDTVGHDDWVEWKADAAGEA